jgi:hypothetical protein
LRSKDQLEQNGILVVGCFNSIVFRRNFDGVASSADSETKRVDL